MRRQSFGMVMVGGMLTGCASAPPTPSGATSVDTAWQQRDRKSAPVAPVYRPRLSATTNAAATALTTNTDAVAMVNGQTVDRATLADLLVRSRGAEVLEQLVAHRAIEKMARDRGLTITVSDVAFERRMSAERIWNPLAPFTTAPLDDASAQQLLSEVLAQKHISPAEFEIVLQRNAYLRKIIEQSQQFSEADYEAEFERAYGLKTRVRHIQLATPGEVARVQQRLEAGESFESLARTFSANQASAQNGGLLEPFSRSEDQLPAIFRQTAFALEPGSVSGAVRVGAWYHLIRVEERIPPESRVLAAVRDELTGRLRRRLSEERMFSLYEKTLREATIEVFDPVLREVYLARAKQRGG